ncbi:hypothetical protein M378DRAFT_338984 [Amanita muscaria Koide BX008]|uniref:Uncharacterized protein n=1 Tax=Amanita muscaria (strain Koide BX008) TaxID=946122 RepID=A0A0C2SVN8_AMAMK|nr:hypothetical protein M378DRAFT_338984 [Amanita muscaria Koide BX008]
MFNLTRISRTIKRGRLRRPFLCLFCVFIPVHQLKEPTNPLKLGRPRRDVVSHDLFVGETRGCGYPDFYQVRRLYGRTAEEGDNYFSPLRQFCVSVRF